MDRLGPPETPLATVYSFPDGTVVPPGGMDAIDVAGQNPVVTELPSTFPEAPGAAQLYPRECNLRQVLALRARYPGVTVAEQLEVMREVLTSDGAGYCHDAAAYANALDVAREILGLGRVPNRDMCWLDVPFRELIVAHAGPNRLRKLAIHSMCKGGGRDKVVVPVPLALGELLDMYSIAGGLVDDDAVRDNGKFMARELEIWREGLGYPPASVLAISGHTRLII